MKVRRNFPLGKAYGFAFCNREEESKRLVNFIKDGSHIYLVAPRRYGKSSLCEHVLGNLGLPWATLDFHLAVTEKDVEQIILNKITALIGNAIGTLDKIQNLILKYVKKLKPRIILGGEHMKLELAVANDTIPAENIAEALLLLDKLLQERDKQAVLVFDEFQEIGHLDAGRGLEGAIRHAAQETQNLTIIFSGSNPHMLTAMFEDERRPLYKLCRKLILDRMKEEHYQPHLNKAATAKWNKKLSNDSFSRIMQVTECHPYYVNYLCNELWLNEQNPPALADIDEAWTTIVEEERSDLVKDFLSLSENQRKILLYIVNESGSNLYGSEIVKKTDIPSGSITTALTTLIEKNYIEKTKDSYRVIVPAYHQLLSKKDI